MILHPSDIHLTDYGFWSLGFALALTSAIDKLFLPGTNMFLFPFTPIYLFAINAG